jgi:hypothetical protein
MEAAKLACDVPQDACDDLRRVPGRATGTRTGASHCLIHGPWQRGPDRTPGALPVQPDPRNVDAAVRRGDFDLADVPAAVPDLPIDLPDFPVEVGHVPVEVPEVADPLGNPCPT